MEPKTPSESVSTMTLVMQLAHANSAGFIHGGEIMKLVDTWAGVASMRHSNGRVVTWKSIPSLSSLRSTSGIWLR